MRVPPELPAVLRVETVEPLARGRDELHFGIETPEHRRLVVRCSRARSPQHLSRSAIERGDRRFGASRLDHDGVADYERRRSESPVRERRAQLFDQVNAKHLRSRVEAEGDEIAPRTESVDHVVGNRRGRHRAIVRAFAPDIRRRERGTPQLLSRRGVERRRVVELSIGEKRDRAASADRDPRVPRAQFSTPPHLELEAFLRKDTFLLRGPVEVGAAPARPVGGRNGEGGHPENEAQHPWSIVGQR